METPQNPAPPADESPADDARSAVKGNLLLLILAYLGFISLGLPDATAGVAWPSVRDTFALPQSGFGLVFLSLSCGYCASSFFGGRLTLMLGVGSLLTVSSLLVAVAMAGYALAPVWPVFVAFGVVWGLGSGAIDAGLNSFVASNFSVRHVNWLHSFYSLGATLGPLLMTAMLFGTGEWRLGYALVGSVVFALTVAFFLTRQRWSGPTTPTKAETGAVVGVTMRQALRHPLVLLQVVVFFIYTGLEFTVGQWIFTLLTESRGVAGEVAGVVAGGYFGAIGVGRFLSGMIADRIGMDRLIRLSMLLVVLGAILIALKVSSEVSVLGVAVIGFGLAPVFPCMMARTPQRLGEGYAAHAVGFQVSAAMLGVALLPALAGLLAQVVGLEVLGPFAVVLAVLLWSSHELLLFRAGTRVGKL